MPTLVLNARNDPFLPAPALDAAARKAAADVMLEFPRSGGHAGFPGRGALAGAPHARVPLRAMNVPAEIFRAYDIRGIAGRTLTAAVVREIGRALGTLGRERGAPALRRSGRDGRLSAPNSRPR